MRQKKNDLSGIGDFNLSYEDRKRLSRPALKAFFKIVVVWKLSKKEQMRLLGIKSYSALRRWRTEPDKVVFSEIRLEMLSWVLRIYKALQIIFSVPRFPKNRKAADGWMKKSNKHFNGLSAMSYIMGSHDYLTRIFHVVGYLEAQIN